MTNMASESARNLASSVMLAYLVPFAITLPLSWVTGSPELRAAATTAIPIPGAVAALALAIALTVVSHFLPEGFPRRPWAFALAVGVGTGVAGALCLQLLTALHVLSAQSLLFALPGPLMGGVSTAAGWARLRARRLTHPPRNALHAGA